MAKFKVGCRRVGCVLGGGRFHLTVKAPNTSVNGEKVVKL